MNVFLLGRGDSFLFGDTYNAALSQARLNNDAKGGAALGTPALVFAVGPVGTGVATLAEETAPLLSTAGSRMLAWGARQLPTGQGAMIRSAVGGTVNLGAQYIKKGSLDKVDPAEVAVSTITGRITAGASLIPLMTINGLSSAGLNYAEHKPNYIAEGVASSFGSLAGNLLGRGVDVALEKLIIPSSIKELGRVFFSVFGNFADSGASEYTSHKTMSTYRAFMSKSNEKNN